VRTEAGVDAEPEARDTRLDRLPMELHVLVNVERMLVRDLLALERGTVLPTVHEHSQDVPVRCGGALLMWGEFEMVEQKLAVRITRLA
jgi:flagellar motor switch protein FliN/FliY